MQLVIEILDAVFIGALFYTCVRRFELPIPWSAGDFANLCQRLFYNIFQPPAKKPKLSRYSRCRYKWKS